MDTQLPKELLTAFLDAARNANDNMGNEQARRDAVFAAQQLATHRPPDPRPPTTKGINALKKSGNVFLDALNFLDKGRNAVHHGLVAAATRQPKGLLGEDYDPDAPIADNFKKQMARDQVVLEEFMKGWRQQTYKSPADHFPKDFKENHPVASIVGDISLMIAEDPLTYVTSPVFTAPFHVAKVMGDLPVLKKMGDALKGKYNEKQYLGFLNVHTGNALTAKESAKKLRDFISAGKYRSLKEYLKLTDQVEALAKKAGVPYEDMSKTIINAVETGGKTDEMLEMAGYGKGVFDSDTMAIAQNLPAKFKKMLDAEKKAGVNISEMMDNDLGYFPHVATDEVAQILKGGEPPPSRSGNVFQLDAAKQRKLAGTVDEINSDPDLLNYYFPDGGGKKIFMDDVATVTRIREVDGLMAMAGSEYMREMRRIGTSAAEAPPGYKFIMDNKTQLPVNDTIKYDPKTAEMIQQQYDLLTNNVEMSKFAKSFDGAQNWWKMWSLGARPAYHGRNIIGNIWNAYLGGLKNPKRYADALTLQRMEATGKFGKVAGMDGKVLIDEMIDNGIFQSGQWHDDVIQSMNIEMRKGPFTREIGIGDVLTPSSKNALLEAGFKVGGHIETNARAALYLDKRLKGASVKEAADHVKKYLFDYKDLSHFEQNTMKRVFPFYTWSRKNIPLQIEALLTQPDKMQKISIFKNAMERDANKPNHELVHEYIKGNVPIWIGDDEKNGQVMQLMNYLPAADLARLAKIDEFANMLSPFISAPIQYLVNYDFFRRKTIAETTGQTTDFLGIEMPVHAAHLARYLVMLNELDRANPGNIFGESTIDPETGVRTRTRSFYDLLPETEINLPSMGFRRGNPELYTDKEFKLRTEGMKFGFPTERESRTDMHGPARIIQYLFGFRLYKFDDAAGYERQVNGMMRDLKLIKSLAKRAHNDNKTRLLGYLTEFFEQTEEVFSNKEMRMRQPPQENK